MDSNNKFKNWITKNYKDRGLVKKGETTTSIVQIIGFWLIGLGVAYMVYFLLPGNEPGAHGMAISFFIIMLGVSFAFPSLLEGNEGLSTMRIVVFMMVNVICFLLIKIGWNKTSLTDIGLDQYWMGVIAFVFGAKATQSFFESRIAVPKSEPNAENTQRVDKLIDLIKRKTDLEKELEINAKLIGLTNDSSDISKSQKKDLENKRNMLTTDLNSLSNEIDVIKKEFK